MFRPSVALLLLAIPAWAGLQLVETKSGKLYEASDVLVADGKLRMTLVLDKGQSATVAVPIESIVPEHVYYNWASQVAETDADGHVRLASWCRKNGLFRQAWREYIAASEASAEVKERLPAIEKEMSEEAATWTFERAEEKLREGDVHGARVLAERVLEDYPESKEVPRTKGLLQLVAEREQFLSEQKVLEEKAERAKKQRRYIEKQLEAIDHSKTTIRNTQIQYVVEGRRRLYHASYRIRRALHRLNDMAPFVEEADLRQALQAIIEDAEKHMVTSFSRLADLRYLSGDIAGALDAAHEVLWVDPDNKAMTDIRKRVLDTSEYGGYRFRYGYYDGFILRRHGYLPPFACPYPARLGFGFRCATPYRLRRTSVSTGGLSLIRYVR